MNYLSRYNLTEEEITKIKKGFNKDIVSKFQIMEDNVTKVFDYLSSVGVSSFKPLIMNRPDVCFMDLDYLKERVCKIDQGLIKFVFENEVENLMSFDI